MENMENGSNLHPESLLTSAEVPYEVPAELRREIDEAYNLQDSEPKSSDRAEAFGRQATMANGLTKEKDPLQEKLMDLKEVTAAVKALRDDFRLAA